MSTTEDGPETILLVEDEVEVRELTHEMLRLHGYNVLDAADPAQALALAERYDGRIDLVLTDVVMPGMNGHQLAKRLISDHPGMRVLYMSGYPASILGDSSAATTFIQKPFSTEALNAKLREILDQA